MFLDDKKINIDTIKENIPRENLINFIAELRSGKYRQTNGRLYSNGAYCAMGVAYRSLGMTKRNAEAVYYCNGIRKSDGVLNKSTLEKLGLNEFNQEDIITLNDQGKSFEFISNYIENEILPNVK